VTGVLNYTLHANQLYARDTEVAHKLFWMRRAKVWFLHQFLLLVGKLKGKIVLW